MTWAALAATLAESGAIAGTTAAGTGAAAGLGGAAAAGAGAAGAGAGLTAAELAAPAAGEVAAPAGALSASEAAPGIDAAPRLDSVLTAGEQAGKSGNPLTESITQPIQEYQKSVPQGMDTLKNLSHGDLNAEAANLQKSPGIPGIQSAPSLPIGGSSPTPSAQPPQLSNPWTERMKGAQHALRFASKLVDHKGSKNTLNLMAMGAGGAANTSDPMATMQAMEGPIVDIAATQKQGSPRLDQAMTISSAPSTQMQPSGGVVNPRAAPATMRGASGGLPPTRLLPDLSTMTPEQRLRMLYGG